MSSVTASAVPPLATAERDAEQLRQSHSGRLNVVFAAWMVIFHLAALGAFFCFRWSSLLVFAATWVLAQNIGIGMSYHRQLTHRGFLTPKWLEYGMAICATLALEGGPLFWVAVHRLHHQVTDKPGDPHSPRDGAWWSHVGWMLWGSIHNHNPLLRRYAPDLYKQPFYVWLSRLHWVPLLVVGTALAWFGSWSWVLWGVVLRVVLGWHSTWLVNSATHMWGSRRFATRDDSRNNWWVALVSGGEGWHNNHHAHPASARHGLAWWELDVNWLAIRLLGTLRLARRIVQAEPTGTSRVLYP